MYRVFWRWPVSEYISFCKYQFQYEIHKYKNTKLFVRGWKQKCIREWNHHVMVREGSAAEGGGREEGGTTNRTSQEQRTLRRFGDKGIIDKHRRACGTTWLLLLPSRGHDQLNKFTSPCVWMFRSSDTKIYFLYSTNHISVYTYMLWNIYTIIIYIR